MGKSSSKHETIYPPYDSRCNKASTKSFGIVHLVGTRRCPIGLLNTENTCYLNSLVQSLYQSHLFRGKCIEFQKYVSKVREIYPELCYMSNRLICIIVPDYLFCKNELLYALADLFTHLDMARKRGKRVCISSTEFTQCLREKSQRFDKFEHHDVHEFYTYLINQLKEELDVAIPSPSTVASPQEISPVKLSSKFDRFLGFRRQKNSFCPSNSWIDDLFQGQFVTKISCCGCRKVSYKYENFIDVPLSLQHNLTNLPTALLSLVDTEELSGRNGYICSTCGGLQVARKQLQFKHLPKILAIHVKRFNYDVKSNHFYPIQDSFAFPVRFTFPNKALASDTLVDVIYELFSVIVHIGRSILHGHYVACVRDGMTWWLVDDHHVRLISEGRLRTFFGSTLGSSKVRSSGYLLFYEMK